MNANETAIQQSSNKVDVSKYIGNYLIFNNAKNPNCVVGLNCTDMKNMK